MKVLAVDDKQDILTLVEAILSAEGFDIDTANSGEVAITLCKESKYSLILLDLMMEGKNGYETLKEIRECQHNHDSKIIALTAKAFQKDREETISAGFNGYISKPFRAKELISTIKAVIDA
jgi:DNA-binding response OmpR family regulator